MKNSKVFFFIIIIISISGSYKVASRKQKSRELIIKEKSDTISNIVMSPLADALSNSILK